MFKVFSKTFLSVLLAIFFICNFVNAKEVNSIVIKQTGKLLKTNEISKNHVQYKTKKRSIVNFKVQKDINVTNVADEWAVANGFAPIKGENGMLKYKKGNGFTSPIAYVQVCQNQNQVSVQSWLEVPTITRVMNLFLVPKEMHIHSGGYRGRLPRSVTRKKVDKLLIMLGEQPIIK